MFLPDGSNPMRVLNSVFFSIVSQRADLVSQVRPKFISIFEKNKTCVVPAESRNPHTKHCDGSLLVAGMTRCGCLKHILSNDWCELTSFENQGENCHEPELLWPVLSRHATSLHGHRNFCHHWDGNCPLLAGRCVSVCRSAGVRMLAVDQGRLGLRYRFCRLSEDCRWRARAWRRRTALNKSIATDNFRCPSF